MQSTAQLRAASLMIAARPASSKPSKTARLAPVRAAKGDSKPAQKKSQDSSAKSAQAPQNDKPHLHDFDEQFASTLIKQGDNVASRAYDD